jgi:hypothetical protein
VSFLRSYSIGLLLLFVAICMGVVVWTSYASVAEQYKIIQEQEKIQIADKTLINPAALVYLMTRTHTPIPPTPTLTPLPPTPTPTPTPIPTKTPTPTPEVKTWDDRAFLMVEETLDDIDFLLKNPERASRVVTRAFLEALAAWELTRIHAPNTINLNPRDFQLNPKFSQTQTRTDSWITDQRLRPYNNFSKVPGNALHYFQRTVREARTGRSYFTAQSPNLPAQGQQAIQAYADYLEQYLVLSNGVLEDVVLFELDQTFPMKTNPSALHMALREPENLDLKKGILLKIVNPPELDLRPIMYYKNGFRYYIQNEKLVIEIHTDTHSAAELSRLIHLALEIFARSGNSHSFNTFVFVESSAGKFFEYQSFSQIVPQSGLFLTRPFPDLEDGP